MPRGATRAVGDTFTNQNGYEYTKTEDRGWVGTHILNMEEHIGRRLRPNEYVGFKSGKSPILDNLELRTRGERKTDKARLAQIEARLAELTAERDAILERLGVKNGQAQN